MSSNNIAFNEAAPFGFADAATAAAVVVAASR
jgi:hypothetical protein